MPPNSTRLETDALNRPPQPETSATVVLQTDPPPAVHAKKRTRKKAKPGRKKLVPGPLRPWPPREGAVPVDSTISSSTDPSATESSKEHKAETPRTIHGFVSPVAQPQSHEASAPAEGPCDTKELSSIPRKNSLSSDGHPVNTVEKDTTDDTQHDAYLDTISTEPFLDERKATASNDQFVPPGEAASTKGEISDSLVPTSCAMDMERLPLVKQIQYHVAEQPTPSAASALRLDISAEPHAHEANVHRVQSDNSPVSGSSRILKPSKITRSVHGNRANVSSTGEAFPAHSRAAAIDIAWNN